MLRVYAISRNNWWATAAVSALFLVEIFANIVLLLTAYSSNTLILTDFSLTLARFIAKRRPHIWEAVFGPTARMRTSSTGELYDDPLAI